jgi:hypothetical protein
MVWQFYSFSSILPSDLSISSFNVLITLTGSGTELHNNNGTGYPVQDLIMLQSPQSCLNPGNLTVVAAVGEILCIYDRILIPISLALSNDIKIPKRIYSGNPELSR